MRESSTSATAAIGTERIRAARRVIRSNRSSGGGIDEMERPQCFKALGLVGRKGSRWH